VLLLAAELVGLLAAGIVIGRLWGMWEHRAEQAETERLRADLRAERQAYAEARARVSRLESALILALDRATRRAERAAEP